MIFESKRLVYEQITKQHAQELKHCLCDPKVYENVDDRIAPTFDELLESFASRELGTPERLEFKNEGIIRSAEKVYDKYLDHVVYGLLKNDSF